MSRRNAHGRCLISSCDYSKSATLVILVVFFFFFNDTATTEIYTLSLHDALPIWIVRRYRGRGETPRQVPGILFRRQRPGGGEQQQRRGRQACPRAPQRQLAAVPARVSAAVWPAICARSRIHLSSSSRLVALPPAAVARWSATQFFMAVRSLPASARLPAYRSRYACCASGTRLSARYASPRYSSASA